MNDNRLRSLLDAGAKRRLTDGEEAELSRLLEDPANREVLERELRPLKNRFGALLEYRAATEAGEPKIPAARLEALLAGVTGRATPSAPKVVPFRRWIGPVITVAALAACLTVIFWQSAPTKGPQSMEKVTIHPTGSPGASVVKSARPRGKFQFGIIAMVGSVRGDADKSGAALGPDWSLASHENLAALRVWSTADLPADVAARVWVDEEAGMLKAVFRRPDGTMARSERPVDSKISLEAQLKQFAEQFTGGR